MTKHTPGPWAVNENIVGRSIVGPENIHKEGYRPIIAYSAKDRHFTGFLFDTEEAERYMEEAEANAKLIAAAPDMYQAITNFLADAEDRGETKDDEGNLYDDYKELYEARAKATGFV